MDITVAQLELYIDNYVNIPYQVLQKLTSVINYGGRITDDKDMRTSDIIISDFFHSKVLLDNYKFSTSGVYKSITPNIDAPFKSYTDYIDNLPLNADPEIFGMHNNASITCANTEINDIFDIILSLQPRVNNDSSISREDYIISIASNMLKTLPALFNMEVCIHIYILINIHIYVCMDMYIYVWKYVYMHIHICVYICIHIYIHTYI
jgi:dynein heavy chain